MRQVSIIVFHIKVGERPQAIEKATAWVNYLKTTGRRVALWSAWSDDINRIAAVFADESAAENEVKLERQRNDPKARELIEDLVTHATKIRRIHNHVVIGMND